MWSDSTDTGFTGDAGWCRYPEFSNCCLSCPKCQQCFWWTPNPTPDAPSKHEPCCQTVSPCVNTAVQQVLEGWYRQNVNEATQRDQSLREKHYSGKELDSGRVSSFRPSPMWVASEAGQALACLHEAWGKFLCVAPPLCPPPSWEALLI